MTAAVEVGRVVNHDRDVKLPDGRVIRLVSDSGKRVIYTTILAKCVTCGGAHVLGKDNEESGKRGVYGIWPQEDLWATPRSDPHKSIRELLPDKILREYLQAFTCLEVGAYTAATVMVRRVLEGVCQDLGITRQPLSAALRQAKAGNMIDARLNDWAQALRTIGNDGAHFTGQLIDKADAEDTIELCKAILDHIYVIPARAQRLINRRAPFESSEGHPVA